MTRPNSENSRFWQYSTTHNSTSKVIEEQTLSGQTIRRVWLPNRDAVVRTTHSALHPLLQGTTNKIANECKA